MVFYGEPRRGVVERVRGVRVVRVSFERFDFNQSSFAGEEISRETRRFESFDGVSQSGEGRFCVWVRVDVGERGVAHLWRGVFDEPIVRDGKFARRVVGVRVFV